MIAAIEVILEAPLQVHHGQVLRLAASAVLASGARELVHKIVASALQSWRQTLAISCDKKGVRDGGVTDGCAWRFESAWPRDRPTRPDAF